uniref:Uncharacterized protein n=1 Tax=Rangifer tarandus platyrhynchus TaxID=3082113 RepID=A0ACB0F496_RANTA|nr:unnamed protein product [Rangifer tarandus platyrhynchus]
MSKLWPHVVEERLSEAWRRRRLGLRPRQTQFLVPTGNQARSEVCARLSASTSDVTGADEQIRLVLASLTSCGKVFLHYCDHPFNCST